MSTVNNSKKPATNSSLMKKQNSLQPSGLLSARSSSSLTSGKGSRRKGEGSSRRGQGSDANSHGYVLYDPEDKSTIRTPQSLLAQKKDGQAPLGRDKSTVFSQGLTSGQTTPTSQSETSDLGFSRPESRSGSVAGSETPHSVASEDEYGAAMAPSIDWEGLDSSRKDSIRSDIGKGALLDPDHTTPPSVAVSAAPEKPKGPPPLTEEDLDRDIIIHLSETPTVFLFELADVCYQADGPLVDEIKEKNKRYRDMVTAKVGSDKYTSRAMQTLNPFTKSKDSQATPVSTEDKSFDVSAWIIHDEHAQRAAMHADNEDRDFHPVTGKSTATGEAQTDANLDEEIATTLDTLAEGGQGGLGLSSRGSNMGFDLGSVTDSGAVTLTTLSTGGGAGGAANAQANAGGNKAGGAGGSKKKFSLANFATLPDTLMLVERMLVQNTMCSKQADYKGFNPDDFTYKKTEDELREEREEMERKEREEQERRRAALMVDGGGELGEELEQEDMMGEGTEGEGQFNGAQIDTDDLTMGPISLRTLWTYKSSIVQGKNVSTLAWNHVNSDILAVGYGEYNPLNPRPGIVCNWSVMNPTHPERVYTVPQAVSSIGFSHTHASLLSVGCVDGSIYLYDIRTRENKAVLQTGLGAGKHSGAVWDVQWVHRGADRGEAMISTASDGRVTSWNVTKGMAHQDLMKLKRTTSSARGPSGLGKGDAFISRYSGGLCIDFQSFESNIYVVGTEDGTIHKCSCSYNEQYLETYKGHSGPVYRVRYSPFSSCHFISCSDDWTIKIWHQDRELPLLSLQCSADSVSDVAWSPFVSTMFASASNDGRVDLWDISISPMDPIATRKYVGRKPTSVLFSKNSPALIIGDNMGNVEVVRLDGHSDSNILPSEEDSKERLIHALDMQNHE